MKSGASIHFSLGPDAPTVALHDASDVGKADPVALKLAVVVQALKDAEQTIDIPQIEASAIVPASPS